MEVIIAKYGEIALKGNNKATFESILVKNIKRALADTGMFSVSKAQSTLYIEYSDTANFDDVVEKLGKVFGLGAIQRCLKLPKEYGAICEQGLPYLAKPLKFAKTFKVEAKRSDKAFPMKTPDIQREFGGEILTAYPHLSVDVHNPDVTVILEIRDKAAYLNSCRLPGAGGIPVGSSGAGLLLLSGGIDSPVAAYMMAKRGIRLEAVHFQSPPYTSERAFMKVESLCKALKPYLSNIRLHCVNFTELQEAIRDNCMGSAEAYSTLILRRMMIRAANMLYAQKLEKGNNVYKAYVTGECVGQVASQTLSAIACTDNAADLPILRPLIGMDKVEIVDIARKIDTFDISTQPFEDCCTIFTPKHPKTNPKLAEVEVIEGKYDYSELVRAAVESATVHDF